MNTDLPLLVLSSTGFGFAQGFLFQLPVFHNSHNFQPDFTSLLIVFRRKQSLHSKFPSQEAGKL